MLDAKIKSKFKVNKNHKKNMSNLVVKSRNIVAKTQKQTINEPRDKKRISNERKSSKQRNRNDSKPKNNKLSLIGVHAYSRNGAPLRTHFKDSSILKHRLNKGMRRTYIESLLQPSLSTYNS